jgi:hypothetical protein
LVLENYILHFPSNNKDTTFILSDANKKIQVTFDQFALFIDWSMHLKNESGRFKEITNWAKIGFC